MKDYRSLEQKIREVYESNRNTNIRRKVANVGRPEDNVKDETSKLAKQGQIKTKIIDEEQIDELSKDTMKSYVNKVDKRGEGVKRGTGLNVASQKIAKQEPTSTLKKTVDAIKNTPHSKLKSSSVYKFGASHAELQKRNVKEEVDNPPEVADKKKKKSDSDMDDMDAKEIKGGKTEVDLNPKTDDAPDNTSVEDQKSKKARKDENKKIGAKGVKEEMNTPFGLPQGLIDVVAEALKGGQKKLDKNHNGKLDGQDFKILRGEKSGMKEDAACGCAGKCQCATKEEVEQVDEVSKDTLQHYIRRASSDAANHAYTAGKGAHGKMTINKDEHHARADKRLRGISKAAQKLAKEEAEEISELSKATVKSYYNKGREQGMAIQDKMKIGGGDWSKDGQDTNTLRKRTAGHQMALRRRRGEVKMSEDVQLSAEEVARIEAIAKGME